jgi:Mg2+/Co2+ transporter CorB
MSQELIPLVIIAVCVLCSGFFSGSETAVTAVNRYRLHYLAQVKKNAVAKILFTMLKQPQKLLGMILIANTFLNMMVSSLATAITIHWYGEEYVLLSTILLTLIVLVFAEVLPKSVAAHNADAIAYRVAWLLRALLWVLSPIVFVINSITMGILRCFGVQFQPSKQLDLSRDELGNLIKIRRQNQGKEGGVEQMLAGILDLDDITVEDVMLPRAEMTGIDISHRWPDIIDYLRNVSAPHCLIVDGNIDKILGHISFDTITKCLLDNRLSKETLLKKMQKLQYVPQTTKLEQQLRHFRDNSDGIAAVVDEYGHLCGLVQREDIIDEIIGEYTAGLQSVSGPHTRQRDGQYWFYGNVTVRDINKSLDWSLPEDHANSIGGLVVNWLEHIPEYPLCVEIDGYQIEILQIKHNKIHRLKITPPPRSESTN